MEKPFFSKIGDFIKKIDPKSWPAFFMFVVVLMAAGALNYVGMEPTFGAFVAVTAAAFFGVGVLSWHIVESRTDDSESQEQVSKLAKWFTVSLDALLLVVNFVRIENASEAGGWNVAAYVIISLAAVVHVAGYLLWTQYDPNRKISRERERALNVIVQQGDKSKTVIATTEKKLEVHLWVVNEEKRLREAYADLEPALVNRLVNEMRKDAYAKLDELDGKQAQSQPQAGQNKPQPSNSFATSKQVLSPVHSETKAETLGEDPTPGGK